MNVKQDLEPFLQIRELRKPRRPIFRIKPTVRVSNREKFEPEHIFLGLYNRSEYGANNPKSRGNLFKLEVVGAFLAESGITLDGWDSVCARIVTDPNAMLRQYREEGLENVSGEDVQSLLSLDALFLALFLSKHFGFDRVVKWLPSVSIVVEEGGDRSFMNSLLHDIVKLENQIPLELLRNAFSILFQTVHQKRELYGLSSPNGADSGNPETMLRDICVYVVAAFRNVLPNNSLRWSQELGMKLDPLFPYECKHLLHCLHLAMVSVGTLKPTEASATASVKPADEPANQWGEVPVPLYPPLSTKRARSVEPDDIFTELTPSVTQQQHISSVTTENRSRAIDDEISTPFELRPRYISSVRTGNRPGGIDDEITNVRLTTNAPVGSPSSTPEKSAEGPANKSGNPLRVLDVALAPVSRLVKAGIKIRGHEGFSVRFEKRLFGATLFLPKISYFGHNCDQLWRNLLAFEDEYELGYRFISYLNFMDDLIDSEEDVEILRAGKHPVFANIKVASNAEVVRLFNTITKDHHVKSIVHTVRQEILEYYNNDYRLMWVEFRTTNLGKPWLFASLVAAILLLVFTVLQTVFTILTYIYTF